MDDQHRHNDQSRIGVTERQEIIAHFPAETQAQHAAQIVADRADSTRVAQVSRDQIQQEVTTAQAGVATIEIGAPAWVGLVVGLLTGAVLGALVYVGRVALPGVGPALSAGPVAVIFLGAGLLGVTGWSSGALLHLLQTPGPAPPHELRATIPEANIPEIEATLIDHGAADVLVPGGGAVSWESGDGNGRPQQHSNHDTRH